jgi:hypothetical protein
MKNCKIISVAAVAIVAMAAWTATSSANQIYKRTDPNPPHTVGVGTEFDYTNVGSLTLHTTNGTPLLTCTQSTFKTHLISNTTPAAKFDFTALTLSGCTEPTETSVLGEVEISNISGTTNGTVISKKTTLKVNTTIFGAVCEYTAGESLDTGSLSGATSSTAYASLNINTITPAKNSFFCPDARWTGTYKLTSPTGIITEP